MAGMSEDFDQQHIVAKYMIKEAIAKTSRVSLNRVAETH